MLHTSDELMLAQLRAEDSASFELLYQWYFPAVTAYVHNHNGSEADAEDIFQEAIIVLLQKVRQPQFVLTATLKTYLFAVAKNIWLKRLRDNRSVTVADIERYQRDSEIFSAELLPAQGGAEKLSGWMDKITAHCARVLKAIFFLQQPIDSLM